MKRNLKERLSESTLEVLMEISRIYNKSPLFRDRRLTVELEKLKDEKNIRILRYLLILSIDKSEEVSKLAASIINSIMKELSYKEIRFLDNSFRNSYQCYKLDILVRQITICTVNKRLDKLDENKYVLCLLSLHENGYIRKNSVVLLKNKIDNQTLPFILLRCNDWVETIQKRAQTTTLNFLKKGEVFNSILEHLDILQDMKSWLRGDLSKIFITIDTMLIDPQNRENMLKKFFYTRNIYIRRILFNYLLLHEFNYEELIVTAIKTKDPIILFKSISVIKTDKGKLNKTKCLNELLRSKSSRARVASLEIAAKVFKEIDYKKLAVNQLCDKSEQVREIARTILSDWSKEEFCNYYISKLESGDTKLVGAILGTGEIGTTNEIHTLEVFLSHGNSRVRRSALTSINKLDDKKSVDYLYEALCSDNSIDSRHATKLLGKRIKRLNAFSLYDLYELEGFSTHVYENIIDILNYVSKWDRLELLLKIASHNEEHNKKRIVEGITKWYQAKNTGFVSPSKEQYSRIIEYFKITKPYLTESLIEKIEFTIK